MIDFETLEAQNDQLRTKFQNTLLFPMVAIDNFCDGAALGELVDAIPNPELAGINKSRDYMFAKNKFEKTNFRGLGDRFEEIYQDLVSDRFKAILQMITGRPVWVVRNSMAQACSKAAPAAISTCTSISPTIRCTPIGSAR
jgi:hypothetical protein